MNRNETFAKILAIVGLLFALVGIGLLVFGIIQNAMYGYIAGPILLVIGIVCYIVMGVLLYQASHQKKKPQIRNQISPRHSQQQPISSVV